MQLLAVPAVPAANPRVVEAVAAGEVAEVGTGDYGMQDCRSCMRKAVVEAAEAMG